MSILDKAPLKLIDTIQAYDTDKNVPCLEGVLQNGFIAFPPQSVNTSSMVFNILPPASDTGTDRLIVYEIAGTATFSGTSSNALGQLYNALEVGLSDQCFDQIVNNESVSFGSKTNNVQRSLCGVELARINNPSCVDAGFGSGTGGELKDFGVNFQAWKQNSRDVLAGPYDVNQSDAVPVPRKTNVQIVSGVAGLTTTMVVAFKYYAVCRVSPFAQTDVPQPAIRGLNNIIFNVQFENDLERMFSLRLNTTGSDGYTYTYTGMTNFAFDSANTQIWARFITPSANAVKYDNPNDYKYAYNEVQVWTNTAVAIPNQTQKQLSLQQISGDVIPDLLLVMARDVQSSLSYNGSLAPRHWYPVADQGAINLKFNNETILNNANVRQLWQMSKNNGLCQVPFEQFAGQDVTYNLATASDTDATNLILGGSMLVINPSKDCQISRLGLCNGAKATWTIQGSVQVVNNTFTDASQVQLVVVAIYAGCAQIRDGRVNAETGLLLPQEARAVFDSAERPMSDYLHQLMVPNSKMGYQGGSLLDALKKAHGFYSDHKDLIHGAIGQAKNAFEKYRAKGYDSDEMEDEYDGGRRLEVGKRAINHKKNASKRYL